MLYISQGGKVVSAIVFGKFICVELGLQVNEFLVSFVFAAYI